MKQYQLISIFSLLIVMSVTFTSCEAIVGIFKAGMWFAVIVIVIVAAIIFWLIKKAKK